MKVQKMEWEIEWPLTNEMIKASDITDTKEKYIIEGETLDGVPHGLCFIYAIDQEELDKN